MISWTRWDPAHPKSGSHLGESSASRPLYLTRSARLLRLRLLCVLHRSRLLLGVLRLLSLLLLLGVLPLGILLLLRILTLGVRLPLLRVGVLRIRLLLLGDLLILLLLLWIPRLHIRLLLRSRCRGGCRFAEQAL